MREAIITSILSGLILTFAEVTEETLVGGPFPLSRIGSKTNQSVKNYYFYYNHLIFTTIN